MASKQQKNK